MIFLDFIKNPELEKIILVEVYVGKEIESSVWTPTGGGSYWCSFDDGEALEVKEDGSAYSEVASVALCDSTASSFYFDFVNQRLYIHTSGNDAPDTLVGSAYKYCIIAYFWIGFTNSQADDYLVAFVPQSATKAIYYLPYLDPSSTINLVQAVKDYFTGIVPYQTATLQFLNDGWWHEAFKKYLWHNKNVEVKIAGKGSVYNEFETLLAGKIRDPRASDNYAGFEIRDARISELKQLPVYRYWISDYSNLEEDAEGKSIPYLFGRKFNITPVCIDTTIYKYKVSWVHAGGAIEEIEAVYNDGRKLTVGTDYTVDLNNGEFTLTKNPKDSLITCDAKGLKCDYDTNNFSENVADFLYYILNTLNGVSPARIVKSAFDDLKANRMQRLAYYLDTAFSTYNFIRLLQQTSIFQFLPLPNNTYTVKRYISGSAGVPKLRDEDCDYLRILYDTDAVYKKIVIKYDKDSSSGEWKEKTFESNKVEYRYGEAGTLTIETILRLEGEAESLADLYSQFASVPPKRIRGKISPAVLDSLPTEKMIVSKVITDAEGKEVSVLSEEVYRILELRKNFGSLKSEVVAIKDSQSLGTAHGNTAHNNIPHDDDPHVNSPHNNVLHENVVHENVPHSNVNYYSDDPHGNVPHDDDPHLNEPHYDGHEDNPHYNVLYQDEPHENQIYSDFVHLNDPYSDFPHTNSPHSDIPHENVVHVDNPHNNVPHTNNPHGDDPHSNVPHDNSLHVNSPHSDIPHENVVHVDNPHNNVPHTNESYADELHSDVPHDDDPHLNEPHHDDPHENSPYYDSPHSNIPHGNTPYYKDIPYHTDYHTNDPHSNGPHLDTPHQDQEYFDELHSDVPHDDDPHLNEPHYDGHEDSPHGNVLHQDEPHENQIYSDFVHLNDPHHDDPHLNEPHHDVHDDDPHGNVLYQDEPHENQIYSDFVHLNVPHGDGHWNSPHSDIPHENVVHVDNPHNNIPHTNNPYADDLHSNVPHNDDPYLDSPHQDEAHSNVPHENVPHQDVLHINIAHQNVAHDNVVHDDIDHADSVY